MKKTNKLVALYTYSKFILASSMLAIAGGAYATESYPTRTVTMVVPYPPGAASDTIARLIAAKLQTAWGHNVVVQNKPGAVGLIGANYVAKAPPDGYTVLVSNTSLIQLPSMMTMPFDTFKDLAPVVQTVRISNLLVVPNSSPFKNLDDFVKTAKQKPGELNYGTWGAGSSAHIHGEMLSQQTGAKLVQVPFQGSAPMMTNLIGSQINSGIADVASVKPHAQSVRVLAVTGPERVAAFPNVPTFTELGYKSFDARGWHGLFMPAGTPPAIVDKMSAEVDRILKQNDVREKIESLGVQPGGGTAQEFRAAMQKDAKTYAEIIKTANIRLNQ